MSASATAKTASATKCGIREADKVHRNRRLLMRKRVVLREGYQNPVDVTFSIAVVSGTSHAIAGAGWLMAVTFAIFIVSVY